MDKINIPKNVVKKEFQINKLYTMFKKNLTQKLNLK